MLDLIRLLLAFALFFTGVYLVYDLFASGFSVLVLLGALACFVLAHYMKPGNPRDSGKNLVVEAIDLIIDIPFRFFEWVLRLLGKLFRAGSDSIDL